MGTSALVPARPDTSGLSEAWVRGIPHNPLEPAWSVYDTDIAATVRIYNDYLARQAGFRPLPPLLIKAMCWTETGAESIKWKSRPMQIGNTGDAGLAELLSTKPASMLILPPSFRKGGMYELTFSNVRTLPVFNIRAGVGYLLLRASTLIKTPVIDDNGQFFADTVRKHDTLFNMSRRDSTTIQELQTSNPSSLTRRLQPETTLRFRHISIEDTFSFTRIDAYQAASTYNNNAVEEYTNTLNYCIWVLNGGAQAADAALKGGTR